MRKLAALTALTFLMSATGCTGVVGDPDVEVTTIHLYADNLGALLATECVQMHKEDGCSRYPNPNECDVMEIVVKGDGSTKAVCKNKGKVTTEFTGGVADGLPILCHASKDAICQQCVDIYGNNVYDNCSRGAAMYRARGALLVMDRNRNGVVDDGTELFGAATDIGGAPAADGFEALAKLDTNGNGIVERGDLLFGELKLWRDANRDGLSQKGELEDLASAGIIGMEVQGSSDGPMLDEHGNDVSMRASFIRADGRKGLMVDVLFGVGR